MAGRFEAEVAAWVKKSERLMLAVFQTAAQYAIEEMVGRTRVDTGFMRGTINVSTVGPTPIDPNARPGAFNYPVPDYALTLAGMRLGETVWATYTASYARVWEYRDGMVRLTAQNWQSHVNRAVADAQARVR